MMTFATGNKKLSPSITPISVVAPNPTQPAPTTSAPTKRFLHFDRFIRLLDFCINVYSLLSFVTTSTLVDMLLMRQAVFMDDVANGVYDFAPEGPSDVVILHLLRNATSGQSKHVGLRDAALATPDGGHSLSWCLRVGITLGVEYHAVYNNDGVSRRYLRYVHTKLPPRCVGWTVAPGGSFNDSRILAVDDARAGFGQSYLHCSDPRYYTPPFGQTANVSSFQFRAGYVVAQQHFAGGSFGIETHISHCKAEKIGDSLMYKVSPFLEGDTSEVVNVLFSTKNWALWLLDYVGQSIVLLILIQEVLRSSAQTITYIPTQSYSLYAAAVDVLCGREPRARPTLDGGYSVMSFAQIWLANPCYLIGNCMYALGTTNETQTLVETFFWQYSVGGRFTDLAQATVYAMRHAWVSVAVWSVLRLVVTRLYLPFLPRVFVRSVHMVEVYCSCRAIVLAFLLACLVTAVSRGHWFLTDRMNVIDVAYGLPKSAFWSSEDMTSLSMSHTFGILFATIFGLITRGFLAWLLPGHRTNSFFQAIDRHRVCSGFDMPQLLSGSRSLRVGDRWVLLLPLADVYLIFSSVNLLRQTAMPSLPSAPPGHAVECITSDNGTVLELRDAGIYVPELAALQQEASGYLYCAVI
ncbi:hypothetical protein SDRG_16492 [Saprolegnia diclina VS20]|uniref:Uncharacterized protein n=1 Tax=Saprolegnia diclina (strain VS20) TaxID=1156394 RepID=T0R816_SAPDV|nr:hypothetical protein SDRG_16492 [Saprolegnia diclina VS20]EQC25637.1 hypothetical protein SDRG_16492 [Saprolegnia diclina VS20]|eukprot:XP_008620928.1 hypothetical protein SDRG_16492 [Saprolegnia diclina VS20]